MVAPITAELRLTTADFMSKWAGAMAAVSKGATQGQSRLSLLGTAAQDAFGRMGASSGLAGSAVDLLSKSGGDLGATMGGALPIVGAVAAGVGALTMAAKAGVDSFVNYANEVIVYQRATGASAQEAERMVSVTNALGVSVDDVARGMGFLAKNIVDQPQKFAEFGVQIARNKDGTADLTGTLLNLGDAYKSSASDALRLDAAKTLLGRGFQSLSPLLATTRDQINELGQAAARRGDLGFSQGQIDSARQYQIETKELGESFSALGRRLGADVVPELTSISQGLTNIVNDAEKAGSFLRKNLADAFVGKHDLSGPTNSKEWDVFFKNLKNGQDAATAAVQKYRTEVEKIPSAAAKQDVADLATANQELDKAVTDLQGALQSDYSATNSLASAQKSLSDLQQKGAVDASAVASAQKSLADAHHNVGDAQRSQGDAQRSLNDLLAKGKVDATQVAEAEKELERATRSTDDARKSLADAEQKLADVRRGASPLDRQQADLRVAEAADTEAAARKNLSDLMQSGAADGLQMAQAEHAVKQAQLDAAKAGEDRNAVLQQGTDGAPDTVAAQGAVEQATRAVADATDAQNTAADKLRTAQAGDPAFDDNVAKARQSVADASYRVQQAQDAERDAGDKLRTARAGDPDFYQKLSDAHNAVATAGFAEATAFDKLQTALGLGGPAAAALRGQLETLANEFPPSSPYVAGLLGLLGSTDINRTAPLQQARPGFLPKLAGGGIVKARPGGILANIGEGPYDEAVVPLTGGAGPAGGVVINLTVNGVAAASMSQFAAQVEPAIRAAMQQAAARTPRYGLS